MAHKTFWNSDSMQPAATDHARRAHAALDEGLSEAFQPGYTGMVAMKMYIKNGGLVGAPTLTFEKLASTEAKV